MVLHNTTFEYYKPTEKQLKEMETLREAAKHYYCMLETHLHEGADKTFVLRSLRSLAMWVNVCITRDTDGQPRD
jgi:hypothetical protein